jgi:putative transposase
VGQFSTGEVGQFSSDGNTGVSKSQVSRLVEEIDERVNAFLSRPLEGEWPYVWIDATYVKAREAGRIMSIATIIAVGVNTDGRREVLGVATGPSEAETFWKRFLRSLADRGLRGVKLVIADDHKGLRAAAARVFHATLQRCRVPSPGFMPGVPSGTDRSLIATDGCATRWRMFRPNSVRQ